jgi:hypothetical protein
MNWNVSTDPLVSYCSSNQYDFCIARESARHTVRMHVKTNVVRELALDANFTLDFPLLIANMIIVRKAPSTLVFLEEWWKVCQVQRYIDPFMYGAMDQQFRWSTSEQGVLSVLVSNWVRTNRLPLHFPSVMGRYHDKRVKASHYGYLNNWHRQN